MPSVTAEEAAVMGPWIKLAGHLGNFAGQMTEEPIRAINVLYDGVVSEMNLKALDCAVIAGILKSANPDVNLVSAPDRGERARHQGFDHHAGQGRSLRRLHQADHRH
jgi:D-3-phosphoglycerate dehydrogenase (EC 1.1.1.95)